MTERSDRAVTVRFDEATYEALQLAGELAGTKNATDTLRQAAKLFIKHTAEDTSLIDEIHTRQANLQKFLESYGGQAGS